MVPVPWPDLGPATAEPSDRELVLNFESLGDNCELGMVQRLVGVEPLGLFRFAGVPLPNLVRALNARLEGIDDPARVFIEPENDEFMVRVGRYDFVYHAQAKIGAADPVVLHRQQTRTLRFLADKFLADAATPEKLMVFRQNEPLLARDLVDLRAALARVGPRATLLWVQAARAGHPPGTVDVIDPHLLTGYVRRLAHRRDVPGLDLESWLTMLRRAWAVWPARIIPVVAPLGLSIKEPVAKPLPPRVDAYFGNDGNAVTDFASGWSTPEEGFTWAIDDRSTLILPDVPAAKAYWLEMDVVPFEHEPSGLRQSLTIHINGILVHVFDPLGKGVLGCRVRGEVMEGRDRMEILLDHPKAARPMDVSDSTDHRRLAITFRSLTVLPLPPEQPLTDAAP